MGRIHVLSENVANKIAAGEVVERPASVVKELLENSLDAGARRIRVQIEAGGKKLIQITDDGCGMVRDDAMLAFERHATSKIRNADDLLTIATLGFRGEALPSIASVSRLRLETHAPEDAAGTVVEIAGGKILTVEEAGLPLGTCITVRDLFYNIPARRKFLKAESTELSHIASLVTHYALAHPEMHWELHSSANAMLVAPPVADHSQRIYQVFGKETLDQLIPLSALLPLERVGLPQPPPWRRSQVDETQEEPVKGEIKLHGFVSRPEIQKLNRNSIFIFVNGRLIRDRLVQHALTDAYRNIIPPTVYPVVLLFLEMPATEVDVNVHPSKVEVRFRQSSVLHDFIRDSVRAVLMKARPVPSFMSEIHASPKASPSLSAGAQDFGGERLQITEADASFALRAQELPPMTVPLQFEGSGFEIRCECGNAGGAVWTADFWRRCADIALRCRAEAGAHRSSPEEDAPVSLESLASLRPVGQIRESFILAINSQGLWIIDQHVAHERILFERIFEAAAGGVAGAAATPDADARGVDAGADGGLRRDFRRTESQWFRGRALRHAHHRGEDHGSGRGRQRSGASAARNPRAVRARRAVIESRAHSHQHRRQHRLSRGYQGQHAAGAEQNGVAAARTRQNRLPHELSPWTSGSSAVFC